MAKSGSVSRQRPRSSPTTFRPDSASSFARMVPVRPTPTITASTGLSRVAMSALLPGDEHVLRVAGLVHLGAAFEDVEDRHRLRGVGHAVLVDMTRVHGGDAWETDQLPAGLVAVAAVDRVAEEALDGVVEQQVEEEPCRHRFERELAVLEPAQHIVLLAGGELFERLAEHRADLADRRAVDLLRGERRPVALLRHSLGMRPLAIHLRHRAEAAEELLIDEIGDAGFLRARPEVVGGDEA